MDEIEKNASRGKLVLKWILLPISILVSIFLIVLISEIAFGNFVEPEKCVIASDVNHRKIASSVPMPYRIITKCYKVHELKFWTTPFWGRKVEYSGWLVFFTKQSGIWMYKGTSVPISQ